MSYQMDESSGPVLFSVQFVEIFCISQQMRKADLMVLDLHIEIAAVPVCYQRRVGQTIGKLGIYGLHAPRLHLVYVGKEVGLEYPVPVQFLSDCSPCLVSPCDR